jgi:hypothetical protein
MALRSPPQHISTGLSSRWAIVRLERRNLVWINVTPHPTAEWNACQIKARTRRRRQRFSKRGFINRRNRKPSRLCKAPTR